MNSYIVMDLENPNIRGNSICAIAVTVVKDHIVVDEKYTLINPEDRFDAINSQITGVYQNQVLNAPTLKEYWTEIKELLENNIIVGHNVTYDLNVLSKSLSRYDIPVPEFRYCCTLELSRKFLQADSYHLENLCEVLGFVYKSHVASEDVKAAQYLFEYINSNYGITSDDIHDYHKTEKLLEHVDERLITNINNLAGIIEGITADQIINEKEVKRLQQWLEENQVNKSYMLFHKIINEIALILEDNIIDLYEQIKLRNIVQSIRSSKLYNETTLGLQLLEGIVEGISCDDVINEDEIINLQRWLNEHDYLKGVYPFDKIYCMVENVLTDGVLSEAEKEELAIAFRELYSPVSTQKNKDTKMELEGKTFCLSGEFSCASKSEVSKKLVARGAIEKSGVSSKLDYLFVGGAGSAAWKFGKIGGKIAKAMELQEKGAKVRIVSEDELMEVIS